MDPLLPGTDCRIGDQPTHAVAPYPRFSRSVLVIDKGRSTRYALRREVAGESYFPLYQIDKLGKAHLFATLYSLYPADSCAVFDEQSGEWQLYDGLPWYLNDLRPVGFLGRAWESRCTAAKVAGRRSAME